MDKMIPVILHRINAKHFSKLWSFHREYFTSNI